MPWKGEKDPYKIWLSEIILQQTRVEQGWNYYLKFIDQYPDIHKLAKAKDEKVFKLWEGLGYYSRCRNLITTARFISSDKKGLFPSGYSEILALKGVGTYTASAIASFAYNLPYAVVDGNVFRVISRVFGIRIATDSTEGKKFFTNLATELLDKKQPGVYNQAIMDFGAVVCKPQKPDCNNCPFNKICVAFKNKLVESLPIKEKKLKLKKRNLSYIILDFKNKIMIRKRMGNDIWQGLFEFYPVETAKPIDKEAVLKKVSRVLNLKRNEFELIDSSPEMYQQLSHQKISGRFFRIKLKKAIQLNGFRFISIKKLPEYAFPRFINSYLRENTLSANKKIQISG